MSEQSEVFKKKKSGLGRGLGSLLGEHAPIREDFVEPLNQTKQSIHEQDAKLLESGRVWQIDITKLKPNAKQPRRTFSPEPLKELANSVKEKGILQPIVAREVGKDSFEIIAGERRWRAAQAAGLANVPVILKNTDDKDAMELALIENIQREDLNPVEEAEAYHRLLSEYQMTQQQVAEKVGKDRATVANSLRLLGLSPEVRTMLAHGEISSGHAKVLLSVADAKQQKSLAERVKYKKISVRELERLLLPKQEVLPASPSDKAAHTSAQDLQKILGTKVTIDYSKGRGKLSIHFYSDEELNSLLDKIKDAWQI